MERKISHTRGTHAFSTHPRALALVCFVFLPRNLGRAAPCAPWVPDLLPWPPKLQRSYGRPEQVSLSNLPYGFQ